MKDLGGFEKYQATMADWVSATMSAKGKGVPDPEDFSQPELELFNEVFRRFADISEAVDNIELCTRFVSARTPRGRDLKLDAYLNYHISFYLQEIYILKERLKKYAKKVMRLRRDLGHAVEPRRYTKIIDLVERSLSSIVSARGSHVHDRPFTGDEMRMLGMYSFLAVHSKGDTMWRAYARAEYSDVRRVWVKRLVANQAELKELLDAFFSFLHLEVFESGLATPPNNSSNPTLPRGAAQRRRQMGEEGQDEAEY
ncbi:TPA: hypothetical protein QDZ60_000112 [Stenotrophomonas maltophilia]|nr:hypothetical protein [Stenotrophomonas maltophilia]